MNYCEAPARASDFQRPYVFLAGGITGCPDWQRFIINVMADFNIGTILNPRRSNFDINDKSVISEQIKWEFNCLWMADIIPFWFCKETLCPIALYELGVHLTRLKSEYISTPLRMPRIAIGVEAGYVRAEDVWLQAKLAVPGVEIYDTLPELGGWIRRQTRDYGAENL